MKNEKPWNLEELQEAVGGYIDDGSVVRGISVFVDDEGLLKEPRYFFIIPGITRVKIAGKAVVMNCTSAGDNVSVDEETMLKVAATKFYELKR